MKVIEQEIFYTLLEDGGWSIYSPIWKNEQTGKNYATRKAEQYSWVKNPLIKREFKPKVFEVVEIDVSKLKSVYKVESKDLRKKRKK